MRLPLTILFLTICGTLYAPGYNSLIIERSEGIEPFAGLLRATAIVESGNNHLAYNAQEAATTLGIPLRTLQDKEPRAMEKLRELLVDFESDYFSEIRPNVCGGRWNGRKLIRVKCRVS